MDAHSTLRKHGYNVESFGSGVCVKLPGKSIDKPVIYEFGTPYSLMYNELVNTDKNLYQTNGVLNMLERNMKIKDHPERFQTTNLQFDVIITCEERVFDQVIQAIDEWQTDHLEIVHIVNVDIKDNFHDAFKGSQHILELCQMIEKTDDLDGNMESILKKFAQTRKRKILHSVAFY
ncbi:RNA polymerase II subunit A C-terminal domain phosphatase SSU72-like isoform X1 [Zophobas morio]